MTRPRALVLGMAFSLFVLTPLAGLTVTQEPQYGLGTWDADALGNHRVVVRVAAASDAVVARVGWRRRDLHPEAKHLVVVDATSGVRVTNVARIAITRDAGDIAFQPKTAPGDYYIYYLPNVGTGRSNYPKITYPAPEQTADAEWLRRNGLTDDALPRLAWMRLPRAQVTAFQAVDALNSFWPMEVVATTAEMRTLRARYPGLPFLVFPEDRAYPIKMTDDLPQRWIQTGPGKPFHGEAARGEFYVFQLGVFADNRRLEDVQVTFGSLLAAPGKFIAPSKFHCLNLGGIDSASRMFRKRLDVEAGKVQALWCGVQVPDDAAPGDYTGTLSVGARGTVTTSIKLTLTVQPTTITAAGDDDPARLSRLRWLNSTLAVDDDLVPPYTPVTVAGRTVSVLGRTVIIGDTGLPSSIKSYFAPEMTHVVTTGREVLAAPIALTIEGADGQPLRWTTSVVRFVKQSRGAVSWATSSTAGHLTLDVWAQMEFDGTIEYTMRLRALQATSVRDVRLEIPVTRDVAKYMMGMGLKGGLRPAAYDWAWNVKNNQDSVWIGDVNAGLQVGLKDDKYVRPLNTNFYLSKPLVMPASWENGGKGGCHFAEQPSSFVASCSSGARDLGLRQSLYYNARITVTPFKPLDTRAQWSTRYFHAFKPVAEIAATGANTINVHHANAVNPWINYPFLRPAEMKAYVDQAHARGMKVKIYYTVRELSNHAPEIFALRSLGYEVLADGPGGGFSWLQEHLGDHYIAAWFVPELKDAAVINSGVSRWHNYYVEGLNWLVKNVGIDGLYIDDVAFDRLTMKRVRKVLDRNRPGALIDLHSANQFNPRDGFANSANLYLEHFPYLNRLWFGEYFDYNQAPDFWLIEMSGIPFGLMGEMLQDGGNPWRGMVFGMTSRLPWAGDPRALWKAWDEFGLTESRMVGYWVPNSPVRVDRPEVLATTYVKQGRTMVALASWAKDKTEVKLTIDWARLGLDPATVTIEAPAIEKFQDATTFVPGQPIWVEPGRGWLLVLAPRTPTRTP
jgi:hypothetical protein